MVRLGGRGSAGAAGVAALTGIAHLVLVFLCLRLLFPDRPRLQIVGVLWPDP